MQRGEDTPAVIVFSTGETNIYSVAQRDRKTDTKKETGGTTRATNSFKNKLTEQGEDCR